MRALVISIGAGQILGQHVSEFGGLWLVVRANGTPVRASYNGYWYWGRPTLEEIRGDMRAISMAIRSDWELR